MRFADFECAIVMFLAKLRADLLTIPNFEFAFVYHIAVIPIRHFFEIELHFPWSGPTLELTLFLVLQSSPSPF